MQLRVQYSGGDAIASHVLGIPFLKIPFRQAHRTMKQPSLFPTNSTVQTTFTECFCNPGMMLDAGDLAVSRQPQSQPLWRIHWSLSGTNYNFPVAKAQMYS